MVRFLIIIGIFAIAGCTDSGKKTNSGKIKNDGRTKSTITKKKTVNSSQGDLCKNDDCPGFIR
ncbi:MAG: hypothetical protein JXR95_12840 [Deltaproteobacteria bacterium]|nr:hypothetical protein [Deltaproteobacteria bacterium]